MVTRHTTTMVVTTPGGGDRMPCQCRQERSSKYFGSLFFSLFKHLLLTQNPIQQQLNTLAAPVDNMTATTNCPLAIQSPASMRAGPINHLPGISHTHLRHNTRSPQYLNAPGPSTHNRSHTHISVKNFARLPIEAFHYFFFFFFFCLLIFCFSHGTRATVPVPAPTTLLLFLLSNILSLEVFPL